MKINKSKTGIIGLITLLVLFGGGALLSPEQLDNAYYCTATDEVGIFYGGISGTGLTAYPYAENRTDYVRCNKTGIKGVWLSLIKYAEEQGLDPLDIMNTEPNLNLSNGIKIITIEYPNGKIYECYFINEVTNNSINSISQCNLKGG